MSSRVSFQEGQEESPPVLGKRDRGRVVVRGDNGDNDDYDDDNDDAHDETLVESSFHQNGGGGGDGGGDGDGDNENDARSDSSSDNEEEDQDNAANRSQFQATQQAEVLRRERRKTSQESADCGVIESVELVNFMCHKYLKVDFGPRINFIIGHNGSGKSAILTAITICLGGKPSSTNRATHLRSLIKEGESIGEITMQVKNMGQDAYRHDIYGDHIFIERRFALDSNTLRLKNADGKMVSTRRDELTAICDHFMLQPDNPMLILSQDAARQFLASSSPIERYQLFLKGTLLLQLQEDYNFVWRSMEQLRDSIEHKRDLIPDLEMDVRTAKRKLKQMEMSIGLEKKIDEVKCKLAWAQVYHKEELFEETQEEVHRQEAKLDNAKRKIEQVTEQIYELGKEKETLQENLIALQSNESPYEAELEQVDAKRQLLEIKRIEAMSTSKQMNKEVNGLKTEIDTLDTQIEETKEKMFSRNNAEIRNEKRAEIARWSDKINALHRDWATLSAEQKKLNLEQAVDKLRWALIELTQCKGNLEAARNYLEDVQRAGTDKIKLFSAQMPDMLKKIKDMADRKQFRGGMPIGPIGLHIALKDESFAQAIDAAWGPSTPYAFIVRHPADIPIITALFRQFRYGRSQGGYFLGLYDIFCAKEDSCFDYRPGVPELDERYTTVLQKVEIDHPLVLQTLINVYRIEATVLVNSRENGERLTRRYPEKIAACFDYTGRQVGHRGGGHLNTAKYSTQDRGCSQLCTKKTGKDRLRELQQACLEREKELSIAEQDFVRCKMEEKQAKDRFDEFSNRMNAVTSEIRLAHTKQEALGNILKDFEDSAADETYAPMLQELEKEKIAIVQQLGTLKSQFAAVAGAIRDLNVTLQSYQDEENEIRSRIKKLQDEHDDAQLAIDDCATRRDQAEALLHHIRGKVQEYQERLQDAQATHDELEETLATAALQAMEFCDGRRIEKDDLGNKPMKSLEKELRQLNQVLESREAELGSLEDVAATCQDKIRTCETAKADILTTITLCDKLETAYKARLLRWTQFREFISLRARVMFVWLLNHRNYSGSLVLKHDTKKLILKVETTEQAENEAQISATTRGNNKKRKLSGKDPRSLSGGEKSFSTVCFLLALWEAMDSNLRALDEFDVFMDSVNRRTAMKMMIDSARQDARKQFILITPQAMDNVNFGPDVKVVKLDDPKRRWQGGQTTLDASLVAAARG